MLAILVLACAYALWFPVINAALAWRPNRVANFAGHPVAVPFLWTEDRNAYFTLRHPGQSIFDPFEDSISLTRTNVKNPEDANSYRRRWLYLNRLGSPPFDENAGKRDLEDRLRLFNASLGEFSLIRGWKCAKLAESIKQMTRLECLSEDSNYILRFDGRPTYLEDFKNVAQRIQSSAR